MITGDNDLLALHPFRGAAAVTPAAFLARIRREQGRAPEAKVFGATLLDAVPLRTE